MCSFFEAMNHSQRACVSFFGSRLCIASCLDFTLSRRDGLRLCNAIARCLSRGERGVRGSGSRRTFRAPQISDLSTYWAGNLLFIETQARSSIF